MTTTNALLFELINSSNPEPHYKLKPADVVASDPQLDISTIKNSKILLTAVPGSGLKGTLWVYYSRESMGNVQLPTQLMSEQAFTVQSILAAINQKLLIPVTLADIEPFSLPVLNVGDILTLDLVSHAESFAWVGSTEISILYGLPPEVEDAWTLFNTTLPANLPPR